MSEFCCSWSLNTHRTGTITWKIVFLADAERQSESVPFQDCSLDSLPISFHLVCNGKNAIKWREWNSGKTIKWLGPQRHLYFLEFQMVKGKKHFLMCWNDFELKMLFLSYIVTVIQRMNYGIGKMHFLQRTSSKDLNLKCFNCCQQSRGMRH